MSEKIWKIFGIFGMVCLLLILAGLILNFFTSPIKYRKRGIMESNFNLPLLEGSKKLMLPPVSLQGSEELGGKEEPLFKAEPTIPSRMIIKTSWLNLVVKDVLGTIKKISKFVEEKGGWTVSSRVSEYEKVPSGSITVRVPAENFDEAMDYFKSLAVRVSNESTQAQDITEEYVDLQSRLRNLEAAEKQLLEIMSRAGKMSEVLEVHRELTNVRQQIEQTKGRMQYLEQSVKMSSITVNLALSEELLPVPPAEKWRPKYIFLQTWKNVLNFWKEFSYFLIKLVVWAQVWLPTLLVLLFALRIWKKRKVKVS